MSKSILIALRSKEYPRKKQQRVGEAQMVLCKTNDVIVPNSYQESKRKDPHLRIFT